jgi:MYXO-CTERM domain-containing protein
VNFISHARSHTFWLITVATGVTAQASPILTPADAGVPVAVQPSAGLGVTGGVTDPFFSGLSALTFPTPAVINILGNIQAFDSMGNPISTFQVTGVTVTQGGMSFMPPLLPFVVTSPVTYTSTLNPAASATVSPGELNLAFTFDLDSSMQYSYTLDVSGVPDGGFVTLNDIEPPRIPEPGSGQLMVAAALVLVGACRVRRRRRSTT